MSPAAGHTHNTVLPSAPGDPHGPSDHPYRAKRAKAVRPALSAAEQGAGYLSNLLGVLANAPAALEAYRTLSQINARAGLTLQEREVVQLVAGTRHGCTFCVAGHTALARNKANSRGWSRRCAPGHAARRAAAGAGRLHRAVINTRGRVSAELQALREVGYTDGNALEVIVGVGLATICNFGNNLAQTPLNTQLADYAWSPKQ